MNALEIRFQPKQVQLFDLVENSPATWIGYGGSRGGAKSYALRNILLWLCWNQPRIRACLLRRTYDLVRENHIDPMFKEFPFLQKFYHVGDKELRLPNGSTLAFRYGETSKDIEGMIGKEYKYFGVDQAEAFTEKELTTCRSCTRWPGAQPQAPKFILTFNPGNIGHSFLKRIFYDRRYNVGERPSDYAFLQAYGWDNVQWSVEALQLEGKSEPDYYRMSNDERFQYFIEKSQYGRNLNALPKARRIGWLLGSMDKFSGQYYDVWSEERHIAPVKPEPWAPMWLGVDWGFAHKSVALWGTAIDGRSVGVFREYAVSGLSPRALAQEIVARTPAEDRKRIKAVWLSHDAFGKRDERDPIAYQMGEVFRQNGLPMPVSAGRDPISGASLIYDMLRSDELTIDPSCQMLIETMPMVSRDEDEPEKPVKFEGDDAFDALRHLLRGRVPSKDKPLDQQVRETAAKITDPIMKWFYLTKQKLGAHQDPRFSAKIVPSWTLDQEK